jgi:Fic family protein
MSVIYHQPKELPLAGIKLNANKFIKEKSEAEYAIGQLHGSGGEGLGKRFFNANLLISPLVTKEAIVSSRLEGTISTVSDVYKYEAGVAPEYSGTAEVANYRKAINHAIPLMQQGKRIDKQFLRDIHKILLNGVRHKGVLGEFRNKDVWIGENQNIPIEKATYVPPKFLRVEEYMDNLLEYLYKGSDDPLTKAAIIHYQFEAVHPFEDGNGRIGRLLIPLILFEKGRISLPILYMSGYFDSHKSEYTSALHQVDKIGNYEDWLKFFFNSICEQLKQTQELIRDINGLYDEVKCKFPKQKSPYFVEFLGYLFEHPIFNPTDVSKTLKSSHIPVAGLIEKFKANQLISQIVDETFDKRFKIYSFNKLLNLLNG